ncbi:hypothetical protein EYF80_049394 [Liparis tanakae]|uniref:Uncharacterized protein n=1 Tax=Liparis tanakae TaxID=230148 RepID=A0A4Z2FHQ1_9TELE|nr:hypothetical protein EYF80_049394 [Liparis tanakae]
MITKQRMCRGLDNKGDPERWWSPTAPRPGLHQRCWGRKSSRVSGQTDSSCGAVGPDECSRRSRGPYTCQMQRELRG